MALAPCENLTVKAIHKLSNFQDWCQILAEFRERRAYPAMIWGNNYGRGLQVLCWLSSTYHFTSNSRRYGCVFAVKSSLCSICITDRTILLSEQQPSPSFWPSGASTPPGELIERTPQWLLPPDHVFCSLFRVSPWARGLLPMVGSL